jgi:phosphate transport system protein
MVVPEEPTPVFMLTLLSCEVARGAVASLADALASGSAESHKFIAEAELRLDQFDREIDDRVTDSLSRSPSNARELLACMKFMVDLERIGDLLASVSSCSAGLQRRISTQDMGDLIRMATILEHMLSDAQSALANSDLDLVLAILRADAELDRFRNLMLMRHLDGAPETAPHDSIHVVFMAQSLERAGDHAKNLAETVCHFVTGKSVRHMSPRDARSTEQMYLDFLRARVTSA